VAFKPPIQRPCDKMGFNGGQALNRRPIDRINDGEEWNDNPNPGLLNVEIKAQILNRCVKDVNKQVADTEGNTLCIFESVIKQENWS
jgi:hypothetical protein